MEDGYEFPKETKYDLEETNENTTCRRHYEWRARETNAILCGLDNGEFTKVMQCTTTKDI